MEWGGFAKQKKCVGGEGGHGCECAAKADAQTVLGPECAEHSGGGPASECSEQEGAEDVDDECAGDAEHEGEGESGECAEAAAECDPEGYFELFGHRKLVK